MKLKEIMINDKIKGYVDEKGNLYIYNFNSGKIEPFNSLFYQIFTKTK